MLFNLIEFAAKLSNYFLIRLIFLITFSFIWFTLIIADIGLYERGKELVEQKEYQKALKAFELASKTGSLDALTALGVMYIGGIGVEQDNTKGYTYINTAANQSDPKAQYTLGALYYLGVGVTKDLNKAFYWLNLASQKGYLDAKYSLGVMYEFGEGVDQNNEKAYENFIFAARKGNLESQIKVAEMYKNGIGTEKNLEKSAYWLDKIEESNVAN
jgi:uncharacterized protein